MARLGLDLIDGERDAQDRVIAREAAILADVDALVGEIDRREKPHGAAKILARQLFRVARHDLEFRTGLRFEKRSEAAEDASLHQARQAGRVAEVF